MGRDPTRWPAARRTALLFTAGVFGLSAVAFALHRAGGGGSLSDGPWGLLVGWSPALVALALHLRKAPPVRPLGLTRLAPAWLLVALLLPPLYLGAAYGLTWLAGWAPLTMDGPALLERATSLLPVSLAYALAESLGEELGWRGFLVPRLAAASSFHRTALLSSAIWAVWHVPGVVFGDSATGAPLSLALVAFGATAMGIGAVLAWLRLRSGSLWPPVLLHAVHNLALYGVFEPASGVPSDRPWLVGEHGLAVAGAALLCGVWVLLFAGQPASEPVPDAGPA